MRHWIISLSLLVAGASAAQAPEADLQVEQGEWKVPSRLLAPPIASAKPLSPAEDLIAAAVRKGERLVIAREGKESTLTIAPRLQEQLTSIMRSYQTPYAAAVALEPATGRVLAMAEHSETDAKMRGLCTKAIFPAASIFKVVTAAALLEAGVPASAEECFHGGKRRLSEKLLVDSERDRLCHPLSTAMAMSTNVVFAKLTRKHLSPQALLSKALAFRFNRPWIFPVPTEISLAKVPQDEFGLSAAGAGFGDVFLSPLHGAALASAVANGGRWRDPVIFEGQAPAPTDEQPVISEEHAQALTQMLELTVTSGTARRVFRERGYRVEGAVGKTGSLADRNPFRDYSWFIGFAPKENPKIAVAAVVVNDAYWRIRATWLGRETMRLALALSPPQ